MHQRLYEITLHLVRHGNARAGELAQRFGVSERTIYRDVDALSSAGVPVYTERGRGGGIFMLPGYVLDKTLFSAEERAQLWAHVDSAASLGAPGAQPVLDKLAALFGRGEGWLTVDYAPWAGGEEQRALFDLLRDAILQRQVLQLQYVSAEGEATERLVEPDRVFFRGQGWYLHAFCQARQGFRFFKLNRIRSAQPTGRQFAPRPQPEGRAVSDGAPGGYHAQTVDLVLRLAPMLAHRALDEFAPGQLQQQPDGGIIAKTSFPLAGSWLLGYVLSFGADAEVLQPAWLRREVAAQARQLAQMYAEGE